MTSSSSSSPASSAAQIAFQARPVVEKSDAYGSEALGGFECQPCLADAARSDEAHGPVVAQRREQSAEVGLATDEVRAVHPEVGLKRSPWL
jgi:hypothetical protein